MTFHHSNDSSNTFRGACNVTDENPNVPHQLRGAVTPLYFRFGDQRVSRRLGTRVGFL
jgi:hypothetical protein